MLPVRLNAPHRPRLHRSLGRRSLSSPPFAPLPPSRSPPSTAPPPPPNPNPSPTTLSSACPPPASPTTSSSRLSAPSPASTPPTADIPHRPQTGRRLRPRHHRHDQQGRVRLTPAPEPSRSPSPTSTRSASTTKTATALGHDGVRDRPHQIRRLHQVHRHQRHHQAGPATASSTAASPNCSFPGPSSSSSTRPKASPPASTNSLRFRLNSKDREFRTLTGGVIHSTGGAQRDEVPFSPRQNRPPHLDQFTLGQDVSGAEFGILPPGTGNVTNGGKIYTFAITE